MNLLIDSHTVIWSLTSPEKLGAIARKLLNDNSNECFVSQASLIEMTIKINLGKLTYKGGVQELLSDIDLAKFQILSIEGNHLLEYEKLPLHHRDPFDRLIIAQSASESLPIVSKDKVFEKYGVKVIW
jgi:PIN domain nuclease of toxin-antitoxin system